MKLPSILKESWLILLPLIPLPIAMWAAPGLWHWLRDRVPDSILARVVALVVLLFCSSLLMLYSYWRRAARVERARAQGRMICPCTEHGEIMLRVESPPGIPVRVLRCPKCGDARTEKSFTISTRL